MRQKRLGFSVLAATIFLLSLFLAGGVCFGQGLKLGEEVEQAKKKFKIRDREYCLECIDNSACLKCHEDIDQVRFARSVHGANSCNSCHWDITNIEEHTVEGSRIQAEPVTCPR